VEWGGGASCLFVVLKPIVVFVSWLPALSVRLLELCPVLELRSGLGLNTSADWQVLTENYHDLIRETANRPHSDIEPSSEDLDTQSLSLSSQLTACSLSFSLCVFGHMVNW
jgi:hypothetical protein